VRQQSRKGGLLRIDGGLKEALKYGISDMIVDPAVTSRRRTRSRSAGERRVEEWSSLACLVSSPGKLRLGAAVRCGLIITFGGK
jgi:hypothetical protein